MGQKDVRIARLCLPKYCIKKHAQLDEDKYVFQDRLKDTAIIFFLKLVNQMNKLPQFTLFEPFIRFKLLCCRYIEMLVQGTHVNCANCSCLQNLRRITKRKIEELHNESMSYSKTVMEPMYNSKIIVHEKARNRW